MYRQQGQLLYLCYFITALVLTVYKDEGERIDEELESIYAVKGIALQSLIN